jgi:hypothetical protein
MRPRLTSEHRETFLAEGAVRVPGVLPRTVADALAVSVWKTIEEQIGAVRGRPETWRGRGPAMVKFQELARTDVLKAAITAEVREVLDGFFSNRAWHSKWSFEPRPLGPIFPTPGRPWTVPSLHWHLDGVERESWPTAVRVFFYLEAVEPGGGGTFYVCGSHRASVRVIADMAKAGEEVRSASVIKRMKRESAWIAELCSKGEAGPDRVGRFVERTTEFRGVPLRVAEMTGQPGDLILWHPNLMHTYAPLNCRDAPRIALSATFAASEGTSAQP